MPSFLKFLLCGHYADCEARPKKSSWNMLLQAISEKTHLSFRKASGLPIALYTKCCLQQGHRRITFDDFLSALFKIADKRHQNLEDVVSAILLAGGPTVNCTKTDYVKFHDDKVLLEILDLLLSSLSLAVNAIRANSDSEIACHFTALPYCQVRQMLEQSPYFTCLLRWGI